MADGRGFFRELKRRNVWRAAVLYGGAAWALSQGVSQLTPALGLPDYSTRWFLIACAIGFPFWVALAWLYELTPQGFKRESDGTADAAARHSNARKLDFAIIAVLVVAVALLGSGYFVRRSASSPAIAVQSAPARSIAVLPFENLSSDKGNAYFAVGMQDLILTKLTDIGDLKVIARASTERYESHPGDLQKIARQLGVATILEGSVQKSGRQVLINVQLIDAKTDAHIWAQSYTRTLDNIFGVEGEVADEVATALDAKLTSAEAARVAAVPTTNPAAYDAYLRGEYYVNFAIARSAQKADFVRAVDSYTEAVKHDPRFALAWAGLGKAQVFLHEITYDDPQLSVRLAAGAKTSITRALALEPGLPQAYVAQGVYDIWIKGGGDAALRAFTKAHRLQPHYATAIEWMGDALFVQGNNEAAASTFRLLRKLDPNDPPTELAEDEWAMHHRTEAGELFQRALALAPASWVVIDTLARWYAYNDDLQRMGALLDTASASVKADPKFVGTLGLYLLYRRDWPAARKLYAGVGEPGNLFQARYPVELARGDIEWYAGDHAAAREQYERAAMLIQHMMTVQPHSPRWHGELGWVYARLGRNREALRQGYLAVQSHDPWHNTARLSKPGSLWLARIQAQVGQAGEAAAILDKLLAAPTGISISVPLLKMDPAWDPIRHDPGFQALLKKYANAVPPRATDTAGQASLRPSPTPAG